MHFEVPKAKRFIAFGGEYLMIVISILTALALEHGAQTLHRSQLAREASAKIETEIATNLVEIEKILVHNKQKMDQLIVLRKELLTGIRHKVDDKELLEHFAKVGFQLSVKTPTLRREAWEVAVANYSVTWMPPSSQERFSTVYSAMRDNEAIIASGSNWFLDGPRLMDTGSNMDLGLATPQDIYRLLGQMISAYDGINGNLKELQRELRAAKKADSSGD